MSIEEAINFYGTCSKLCRALGIQRQNITYWKRKGYVPLFQQYRLQELSAGKLKAGLEGRG